MMADPPNPPNKGVGERVVWLDVEQVARQAADILDVSEGGGLADGFGGLPRAHAAGAATENEHLVVVRGPVGRVDVERARTSSFPN
eukprot:COSAG02_NODE_4578_length_5200_cov_2.867673_7_plen_86_part_00